MFRLGTPKLAQWERFQRLRMDSKFSRNIVIKESVTRQVHFLPGPRQDGNSIKLRNYENVVLVPTTLRKFGWCVWSDKRSDVSVWYEKAPMVSFIFFWHHCLGYSRFNLNPYQINEFTEINRNIRKSWTRKRKEIINAFGKNRTQDCDKIARCDLRMLQ